MTLPIPTHYAGDRVIAIEELLDQPQRRERFATLDRQLAVLRAMYRLASVVEMAVGGESERIKRRVYEAMLAEMMKVGTP